MYIFCPQKYLCGFYSLAPGVSSAKEIVDLVDYGKDDPIVNLICHFRVDTLTHQLHYPQKPLFRTMTADCLGTPGYLSSHTGILPKPEFYNGQNAIVAVNVHLGCNQEDSLVMNRASLERGMFRSEPIRSYKAEVDNKESSEKRRNSDDYQTETHCEGYGSESYAVVCLRQTSGQLLEAALGKGIASGGCLKSATPFSTPSVDAITDRLHSLIDSSQMHVCQKCKNVASVIQQSGSCDAILKESHDGRCYWPLFGRVTCSLSLLNAKVKGISGVDSIEVSLG
ncbi:DNA-directed RNA polymerase D subunit 2b, partial [Cucurbita argyrosperma subsp. sororia]